MSKPRCEVIDRKTGPKYLRFYSPLTAETEVVLIRGTQSGRPSWEWNGSLDLPTLSPSIKHEGGERWHYYIENGRIRYTIDSPSGAPELTVDLPPIDEWNDKDGLAIWVVYKGPEDFPGLWVVRRWVNDRPGSWCHTTGTYEELKRVIPRGLHRLPRDPSDALSIVESWV